MNESCIIITSGMIFNCKRSKSYFNFTTFFPEKPVAICIIWIITFMGSLKSFEFKFENKDKLLKLKDLNTARLHSSHSFIWNQAWMTGCFDNTIS